jgi:hypothetical protein
VLQMADYVSITVIVASVCAATADYFYIPSQLRAANDGINQCHNLLLWWESLSLVQRKLNSTKKLIVHTVEGALLEVCATRTALASSLPGEGGGGGEEEE